MFKQIKRLGGDSLLFALMNVGTKLIAFLMLPVYTHYLSPGEMGIMENIDAISSILTFVIIFGTDSALAYFFYSTDNKELKERYVQTVLSFRLYLASLFLIVFLLFAKPLSSLLLGMSGYEKLFYLTGIILVFEAITTVILTYFRFQFKSLKVVIYTVLQLGAVAVISFLLLKYFSYNVDAIFWARFYSLILILIALFSTLSKLLRIKIEKDLLKKLLVYGAPLVPASLAFWVITFSNRIFLTKFESLDSVGIYGIAMKIGMVITLLTSSVQMAWRPYSMSIREKPDADRIYAGIFYIIFIIGMLGITMVAQLSPLILKMMMINAEYIEARNYIAFLSMSSFLSFYYLIISVGLFLKEKTGAISKYVGISAVISVILNIVLIPLFSIWGAVAALIISYLFVNVIIFKKSQEVYYIPVKPGKMIIVYLATLISIGMITFLYNNSQLSAILHVVPWFLLLGSIYLTGIWKAIFDKK